MKSNRYQKGDIVTYSNSVIKRINKPYKFENYFDDNYYNATIGLEIVKIQRYIKLPIFNLYRLKTIYKKRGYIDETNRRNKSN